MIQGLIPLAFAFSGAVATGVAVYVAVEKPDLFSSEPQPIIELKQPEVPKPDKIIAETPLVLPGFDVLRVEQDGSTVIAGHAAPDNKIEIWDADQLIASTRSGPSGDFAVVLDKPLSPGPHELIIRATPETGDTLYSAEAGIINIPDPGTGEVTVLVAKAGEATRILQKPEPETVSEPAVETVEIVKADPAPEVAPVQPVLIEAADVEGEKIFIAGTGEPDAVVNIYMNDLLLGTATVKQNGSFLFEGTKSLEPGRYAVRADMMPTDSKSVIARAEVSLLHEPEVAVPGRQVEVAKVEPAIVPEIRTGASVIIRSGDTLWAVSRRNYGEGTRYTTIFEANRDQVRNPDLIYPGQVLKVPDQAGTDNTSDSG